MSQNQEIIESKLCAFVDGELDEAGRVEIEKHLTANPQHRRLLEELRRTSALVRGLPRENAPPELAESFNSQLERSVLLQGVGEESTGSAMRIGLGPRLYAAAAIILLMIGLAAVIYFALPSYNVHPTMASSTVRQPMSSPHLSAAPSVTEPSDQSPTDQSAITSKNVSEKANSVADAQKQLSAPIAVKSSNGEQPLASARLEESNQLRELARKAATDTEALGVADGNAGRRQIRAAAVPSVEPTAMVMLVDSDDLDRTHRRLEDYFAAHDIVWAPADASDGGTKRELEAAKGADRALTLRSVGDKSKNGQSKSAPAAAVDAPVAPIPPGAIAGASTQPSTKPLGGQGIAGSARDAVAAAPQTEPAVLANKDAPSPPLSLQPESGSAKPGVAPAAQQVVFAARMSRRQAAALGDILEREGAAEQARVVQDGASPLAAEKTADELTLDETRAKAGTAFGAGLPASRPSVALALSAPGESENNVAKEDLKKLGGGPTTQFAQAAASTRPDETEKNRDLTGRGASKVRDSASILRKDAVAEIDTTQPSTTAPTEGFLAETPAASPAPVENGAASSLQSTTQPDVVANGTAALSLSAAGSEELVNVVILIRPSDAADGAAQALPTVPQTQPVAPTTHPAVQLPASPASQPDGQ